MMPILSPRRAVVLVVAAVMAGILALVTGPGASPAVARDDEPVTIQFFWGDGCPPL